MNQKTNIGILTFFNADNYGAILQAFALSRTLNKIVGNQNVNIEFVNYQSKAVIGSKPSFSYWNFKKLMLLSIEILRFFWRVFKYYRISSHIKRNKFDSFRKRFLNISSIEFTKSDPNVIYNSIVVGSDQVWNTTLTDSDSTYYLDIEPKTKKISYAASFGHSTHCDNEKEFISKYLPKFDKISVREESAVESIFQLTGIQSQLVLDPVFLLSKEQWMNEFNVDRLVKENYLLIYELEMNENIYSLALRIAKKLGLKVIKIGLTELRIGLNEFKHNFQTVDKFMNTVGPIDFISLFYNADFIVTNSFHGTAFSIIFQKDFYCVPHLTRGIRMESLLQLLGLDSRLARSADKISIDSSQMRIDYSNSFAKLDSERRKSLAFLKQSMADE